MSVVAFLRHGLRLVAPLAVAITIYLYLFPVFQGCAFPVGEGTSQDAFALTKKLHWPASRTNLTPEDRAKLAPFRLLALGDPQLEGDTSIPTNYLGIFPHVKTIFRHLTFQTRHDSLRERVRRICHDAVDVVFEDVYYLLESLRKRVDLFGNDFYLAHIYRTLHWWSVPTHVTVLGDLLGSQWIDDAEFKRRSKRFWNRSFRGAERLPDDLAQFPSYDWTVTGRLDGSEEEKIWTKRLLNVAGNHDIGYAGDLTEERLERFEREFGKANYELRFELPITDAEQRASIIDADANPDSDRLLPQLRIVVVNDMNLDTPANSSALQDATYNFINNVIQTSSHVDMKGMFTVILTHVPLYKPAGVCVDAPFFDFHPKAEGGGLKEQNQLSADASKGFLEGIWGMSAKATAPGGGLGRAGVMLNGHDHEGCDTFHFINQTNGTGPDDRRWEVARWADAQARGIPGSPGVPGRREITVRSMMGDFGGNAGLLSLWFDHDAWEWRFEYAVCPLGTQVFWWLVHIVDLVVVLWAVAYALARALVGKGVDVDARFYEAVSRAWDWVRQGRGRRRDAAVNGKPRDARQ
ncbi:hypothetical protein QQZ08_002515 [Neonectria magnoliae]|uniref:Calcineurin-like phosphoesterase domain-containing protein n=1 Tax=Neonectria magnoliae TaxID=2732573 RepID=A0ABR1ID65_9HYPO